MRLLASLLTILSLVTPALAVDPKSVPVLIRDCVTKVDTKTSPPIGAAMTRSNHPCWRVDSTSATKRTKVYGSTLVNGNFTLYQYNLEDFKEVSDCDIDAAEKRKTLKTWTNIGKGKCIEEIGLAFDWAPADRYIGKFSYLGNGVKDEVVKRAAATCEDVVDLPQYAHFGEAIKADFCGYERTKYLEWGNNTVSNCWYEPTSRTANRTTYPEQDDCSGKRTCDPAYRYNTCTKSSDVPDNYYYWMTFGGPVKTGAADITSHVSIFTIMATLVMAFIAQF